MVDEKEEKIDIGIETKDENDKYDKDLIYKEIERILVKLEENDEDKIKLPIHGVKRSKHGGLTFIDKKMIERQSGVVKDLVKRMGSALMKGEPISGISLPSKIFKAESFLERMCENWRYAPLFLTKAAIETDPLLRFKYAITFFISGLHRSSDQLKPFNPCTLETFEGHFVDGTNMYLEQISHHPAVAAFEVVGPDNLYYFHGVHEQTGSVKKLGANLKGQQVGPNIIKFHDGGEIEYNMPYFRITGLLFGSRGYNFEGKVEIKDKKNGLHCKLKFNPNGWTRRYKDDEFRGEISKVDEDDDKEKICEVKGSWLTGVTIDDKEFWKMGEYDAFKILVKDQKETLPTDCKKRKDIILVGKEDFDTAQKQKEEIEQGQRDDVKLRKAYYKEHEIENGVFH